MDAIADWTDSLDVTAMTATLGRSGVRVSRLGVGAMTWGNPSGLSRFSPAKLAYGGPRGIDDERDALEASLVAGVTLFDTAAMYSGGAAERRLGELVRGHDGIQISTKFPASIRARADEIFEDRRNGNHAADGAPQRREIRLLLEAARQRAAAAVAG